MAAVQCPNAQFSRIAQQKATIRAPCRRCHAQKPRALSLNADTAYQSPSTAPGSNELESLARFSELVPDTFIQELPVAVQRNAATVSCQFLNGLLTSTSAGVRIYQNAVTAAIAYDKCSLLAGDEKTACQLDKALVNVGAMLAKEVSGRVCTEVDPRLAKDTGKLVERVGHLLELYADVGVSKDKLIFRLPATWEGIQGAAELEKHAVATQVFMVYSEIQAVAAAQSGVSVIQPNVGRVRDWYNKNPGAIRDPKGPREDSGFSSASDPGRELVKSVYNYAKKFHPKTQVMASGLRSKEDALALAGCDYLVVNSKVIQALAETPTLQGYNSDLSATKTADEGGVDRVLSPNFAAASSITELPKVTKQLFEDELPSAAQQLLDVGLKGLVGDVASLLPAFTGMSVGQE